MGDVVCAPHFCQNWRAEKRSAGFLVGAGLGYVGGLLTLGACLVYVIWAQNQGMSASPATYEKIPVLNGIRYYIDSYSVCFFIITEDG